MRKTVVFPTCLIPVSTTISGSSTLLANQNKSFFGTAYRHYTIVLLICQVSIDTVFGSTLKSR